LFLFADVFKCFQDKEGNFVAKDTKSLLSLYNAAYLRIPGEQVLDDAIIFTRGQLESVLDSLETTLADEVSLALQTPLFRRVRILETRNYIPIYEKEVARNQFILEFAKLNFNLLQLLYCLELKKVML
jgi:beta-farnesene synthase